MDIRIIGTREDVAALLGVLRAAGWSPWEDRRYETLHDGRVRSYVAAHPPAEAGDQGRTKLVTADLGADGTGVIDPAAPLWKQSACRSCKAPIVWATTRADARVPVDFDPVPVNSGNADCVLTDRGRGLPPLIDVVSNPAKLFGRATAWRRHIGTCPFAPHHRTLAAQRGAQQTRRGRR